MKVVYVTRYALSDGIRKCEVLQTDDDGYVSVKWPGACNGSALFPKSAYSHTKEDALACARAMRDKKIKSLEKQIAKLRKLYTEDGNG